MLAANMHVFAPEVLGVQVLFNARVNWDRIPALPTTRPGTRTSTQEPNECPAMLLPQGAELFAIFIDEHYGMFVQRKRVLSLGNASKNFQTVLLLFSGSEMRQAPLITQLSDPPLLRPMAKKITPQRKPDGVPSYHHHHHPTENSYHNHHPIEISSVWGIFGFTLPVTSDL